jgi:hypothetical protein
MGTPHAMIRKSSLGGISGLLAAACLGLAPAALAKSSEWKDAKGNSFEADPAALLGPLALFSNGTMLPVGMLSPEDCVRFHDGLKVLPERASEWSKGTSKITGDVVGRLMNYEGDHLVADDLKGRPEPEYYMVFYATNDVSQSWDMIGKSTPELFAKLQKDYPGMVQGVLFGVAETPIQHTFMATSMKGGWLVTDYRRQIEMDTLRRMTPTNSYGIVFMTRSGLPLFGPDATSEIQVKAIFDQVNGLLEHVRPDNPHFWPARAHYLGAVQAVAFANGKSGPQLMGNPLMADGLRQRKIFQVDADMQVGADGKVTGVQVKPEGLPPAMVGPLGDALRRACVFVPAVDHGKFVDGAYVYHMDVAH